MNWGNREGSGINYSSQYLTPLYSPNLHSRGRLGEAGLFSPLEIQIAYLSDDRNPLQF